MRSGYFNFVLPVEMSSQGLDPARPRASKGVLLAVRYEARGVVPHWEHDLQSAPLHLIASREVIILGGGCGGSRQVVGNREGAQSSRTVIRGRIRKSGEWWRSGVVAGSTAGSSNRQGLFPEDLTRRRGSQHFRSDLGERFELGRGQERRQSRGIFVLLARYSD